MNPAVAAALLSWRLDVRLLLLLFVLSALYVRGWWRLHRERPQRYTPARLASFLGGLAVLFLAIASPLDAFASLLLQAHMIQHLLLLMIAPPLIWLGQPILPVLRGLPGRVLKNGLGPFLSSHELRRAGRAITHPVVCWLAMAAAVIFWHTPRWYELGLASPAWHEIEHASFFTAALLFWWPVVQVWPSRPIGPRWAIVPYLVLADLVNTGLSAWLVFSSSVVYRTYEIAPRLGGLSALDDQATAGAIMWVPGSIAYLLPALVVAMQALGGTLLVARRTPAPAALRPAKRVGWDLLRTPVLGAILRHPHFRRAAQSVMFALAVAVVIDGWFGPQIAPMNLAGVLPWIHWRGLAVIALLAAGNLFCMACPFTLPRDLARRWLPASRRWPRQLRSKWFAAALLALYLWAYEAFSLWDSPWVTAWIIAGYFATALIVDGLFQGASFCKYVCPIGQFHFVNSLVSPLEVKVRDGAVCGSCQTYDCIRGNERQRGCELHLFQPKKTGNFDCTFCLDCVHACPHDNVGISAIVPATRLTQDRRGSGIGRLSTRPDVAALAMILVFGAFVNAAGMVEPVMERLHAWYSQIGYFATGLLIAPLALACACGWLSRRLGGARVSWRGIVCAFTLSFIPLGFSMWVAHFSYHLLAGWSGVVPIAARIFHLDGPANFAAHVPAWWPSAQILLLDCGLLLTLYVAWRMACQRTLRRSQTFGLVMPWAALAILLYSFGVWILFQPMQMRGMVMN
jgi:cytochrome c oxidase assembly factor CtaG/polyferredoxin